MTLIESTSAETEAWFKLDRDGRTLVVGGAWTISESARLDRELNDLELSGGALAIDGSKISRLDSAGAWLLLRTRRAVEAQGGKVSRFDLPDLYQPLIENLDREQDAEKRVSLADHPDAMCGTQLAPERCVRFADQPVRTAIAAAP